MRGSFCLALCTLLSGLAAAQDEEHEESPELGDSEPTNTNLTGLTFAVGLGYGLPFGDLLEVGGSDTSLDSGISGLVPLSLNVAVRPSPIVSFGLAFQYAPAITRNCPAGATCSASDTYLGAELRFHLQPRQSLSPSISLGGGYEWLALSEDSTGGELKGWVIDLGAGGDIRVTRFLTMGPYVGLRVGQYGSISSRGYSSDISDDEQATHAWLALGLRGTFTVATP